MVKRLLLPALVLWVLGCTGSAAVQAARDGDRAGLRKLVDAPAAEALELDEARAIAEAVLEREIALARGPSGKRGLEGAAACARAFDDALEERASHDDELAARAAMLLVEAGLTEPLAYAHHLKSPHPHWRAVAARSLGLREPPPDDDGDERLAFAGGWRRKLILDGSREVRLGALRAAVQAADDNDAEAVLEAARLDPDVELRRAAIGAAGAIGSQRLVVALGDLWPRAEEEERVAIVRAWVRAWYHDTCEDQPLPPACGPNPIERSAPCLAYRQLTRVVDSDGAMPGVVAALAMVRAGGTPQHATAEQGRAAGLLERSIDDAPARIRVAAIENAPLSWPHLAAAVTEAAESGDGQVAAAAHARALELGGKERAAALAKLRLLAKDGAAPVADAAKRALVAAGDASVLPQLDVDVRAKSPNVRAAAAESLARLGRHDRTAALLADDDAKVRAFAACALLRVAPPDEQ